MDSDFCPWGHIDNPLELCNIALPIQYDGKVMLGDILRKRREELGLDVQDIARTTGMPPKQVIALEADNHSYFVGGKSEIERLTKLYAKKVNMPLDAAFSIESHQEQRNIDTRNTEIAIPAFLINSHSKDTVTLKKPRSAGVLKKN